MIMGDVFEVYVYVRNTDTPEPEYHYVQTHGGGDLLEALTAMKSAQEEHGARCVRLEWRP